MERKEIVKQIVEELLQKGFSGRYRATFTEISSTEFKVDIRGDDVSYLIGQHGKTLLALQLLIRQMYMNQSGDHEEELKIIIDIDDYKIKRVEKIKEMAQRAANKVLSLGREVVLPAMNAFERHIVHDYISENFQNIQSKSQGDEPNRRVVLTPIK